MGKSITLDVALKVLIVKSANDVAVMIADACRRHGSEAFVQRMNEAAQHLGMRRTNFANVNGLPDERQVTTARDLAKLARAIIIAFGSLADILISPRHVRSTPNNGWPGGTSKSAFGFRFKSTRRSSRNSCAETIVVVQGSKQSN